MVTGKRIKKPPRRLSQEDIDRPQAQPERDGLLDWIEGVPGLIFTIVLLAAFVAGMWGLYLLWGMICPLTTAIKG